LITTLVEENRGFPQITERLQDLICTLTFALKNSMLSSAKRRWFTDGADGSTLIPLRFDD
jgi:hypothetical protein